MGSVLMATILAYAYYGIKPYVGRILLPSGKQHNPLFRGGGLHVGVYDYGSWRGYTRYERQPRADHSSPTDTRPLPPHHGGIGTTLPRIDGQKVVGKFFDL